MLQNKIIKICIIVTFFTIFLSSCSNVDKKVELTFWHSMADPKDKVLNSLINDFEKSHPHIKIHCQYFGTYDDLLLKLSASIPAGNPPDMSQVYENWTTKFKEGGIIVPIDDLIKEYGGLTKEDLNDVYPIFIKNNSYDNVLWTFPFNKSIYVFYYNASIFRECGVLPPKNIEEFLDVCKKLTKKDKTGKIVRYGFGFRANVDIFAILYYLRGGKFFNEKETVAIFNDKAGKEVLQFIVDLVNKYKVAYYTKDYLDNDFASGRVASFIATNPHRTYLQPLLSFKLGVAPLPKWNIQTAPLAGTNLAVFSKKERGAKIKQRACLEFIKWLTSTENTVRWAIGTSYLPIRKSALKNEVMRKHLQEQPLDFIAIKQLDNAVCDPRVKIWQEVRTYIGEAVEKALLGKLTASEALDEAAKKVNQLLIKESK